MLAHCSVLPTRSGHRVHLIRQHADQPCRTYCRLATDTSDTATAAAIVVAMGAELDAERMRPAVPSDAPRLHSHHIYSMHLCVFDGIQRLKINSLVRSERNFPKLTLDGFRETCSAHFHPFRLETLSVENFLFSSSHFVFLIL